MSVRCIGIEHRERSKWIDRGVVVHGLIGHSPTQLRSNIHAKRRFSCERRPCEGGVDRLYAPVISDVWQETLQHVAISLNQPGIGNAAKTSSSTGHRAEHVAAPGRGANAKVIVLTGNRRLRITGAGPGKPHAFTGKRVVCNPLGAAGGVLGVSELLRKTRVDSPPMHRVPRGEGRGRRRCRSHPTPPNSDRNL